MNQHTHILVAMSGGVDSSVTAALLQDAGYTLTGATMKLYAPNSGTSIRPCGTEDNISDARRVCGTLGIPFTVFDFTDIFQREVIDRFADGYAHGLTPNPCVDCNRSLKFGKLLEQARAIGCDAIATGHYARITYSEGFGRWVLLKGAVPSKDQSYVLYSMTQDELAHTQLPLGEFCKEDIRALAAQRGLVNARKKDSQDICFIPDGDHATFLCSQCGLTEQPGDFIDTHGKVCGTHRGILHYTIGQRRGLGISADRRLYVIDKNAAANTVTVGYEEDLLETVFTVRDINWIAYESMPHTLHCLVRTRYHGTETPAELVPLDGAGTAVRVTLRTPQRAVSPGQAAVFYDGDILLGGGTITAE